jgi:hypothetical protein
MKFKSNIEVQAGIEDKDGQVGSNGQILASTGSQVDWIDPANIVTSATDVIIECKNTSGVTIAKGTPVYQTGNVGATAVIEVAVADASDEDKMAAIGLLQSDLINNAFGYVVVTGELLNITTSPIDGSTPTVGDTIYVKPGGGLTLTKPTGVNFIQNVGLVGKVSGGNAGSLTVSSIMRSNDVPTPLYIDHDNQRLGVGETSPDVKLHVAGDDTAAAFSTVLKVESTADEGSLQDIHIYNQYDRDIGIKFETLGGENYIWQDSNSDDALIISTGGSSRANDAALILEQDQDVIVPNGRLGIGATNPSAKLEVSAGATASVDIAHFSNSNNIAKAKISLSANSSGELSLIDGSNNTDVFITSNGNSYFNSGKVGIGTTSPGASLEVASTTDDYVAKFSHSTATGYAPGSILLQAGQGNSRGQGLFHYNTEADENWFTGVPYNVQSKKWIVANKYSTTQDVDTAQLTHALLTIDSDTGNVGIGTPSPSASHKLDVNGAGRFSGNVTSTGNISARSFDMNSTYESSNQYLQLHKNQANDGGILLRSRTAAGAGQVDWQIVNQGTTGDLKFYAYGLGGNAFVLDRETGNLQLPEYGAGTLVSDASGNITVSSGGGAGGPYLPLSAGSGEILTGDLAMNNNIGIITKDSSGAFRDILKLNSSNILEIGSSSLATNTIFKNSGNVGIGNTSPVNGKLVVTSGVDGPLNTVRIQHTRDDADVDTRALEIDMNLSGADTTTGDRTNRGIYVDLDSSADGDDAHEHRIHGIESDVKFTGFSDIVRAGQFYAESGNITEKTAQLVGVFGQAIHDANSTNGGVSNMMGVYGYSQPQDLGDVDNAFGGYFLVNIGTNRGNADIGVTKGVEGEISIDKSSTINYGTMIGMSSVIDNNEGTVPNFGNQYLFKGDYQGTKGDNAYGIYTEGDKHYFDGNIGIGATNPTSRLTVGENGITTKIATVTIGDTTAGASLTLRGGSPTIYFDRTGTDPENKILMDSAGLEFKTGTLDAEGDVDFKINPNGDLQLSKGAKISNQENTDIDSAAAEVVATVAISYTAAFFDFVVKKGTNVRSGTVYACHDGTNVEFTETSTNDLGDTSDVTLSVDKTSTNLRLIATVTSDDWSVKSLIRAI